MKATSSGPAQVIMRLRAAISGRSQSISAQIIRGASSTAALKVVNAGLTFVAALLLARFLGVEEYGVFAYAMSWVTLLGVLAGLGLQQVIVAQVAVYHQKGDWAHIRGMLWFSLAAVAMAGIICALGVAAIGWMMHGDAPTLHTALLFACVLLFFRALILPLSAIQNGLRQVVYAQIPQMVVIPATFLGLVTAAFSFSQIKPSGAAAIILQLFAVGVGLVIASLLMRKGLEEAGQPRPLPDAQVRPREWMKRGLPMMLMGSMVVVNSNADILMLGALQGPTDAGLYKVATRISELILVALVAVGVPLNPLMARLHAAGDHALLQRTITRWAQLTFVPAAALVLLYVWSADIFLGLFGADFATERSRTALLILSAAQLVNVASGPVGGLLVMTSNERPAALCLVFAAVLNVVMNFLLIPQFGVVGAAVATAISTVTWNALLVYLARTRLGINSTILSFRYPR